MVEAADGYSIHRKRKAITAFFPYAILRERDGHHELLEILFHLFRAMVERVHHKDSGPLLLDGRMFMWRHIEPLVATLLNEESPNSMKQAMIIASPYLPWTTDELLTQLLAAATSMVPYTDAIGQSVVDTLLRIANDASPQPQIPAGMWSWLNKRPPLPPASWGRFCGSTQHVVRGVRALKDTEILKSYFLLIWSEWDEPQWVGLDEMCASLREDFGGIGMERHRQDLLRHLDNVLGRMDQGPEHLGKLRKTLREVQREAAVARIRELPEFVLLFGPLTTRRRTQGVTRLLCVQSLFRVYSLVFKQPIISPGTQFAGGITAGPVSGYSGAPQFSFLSPGSLLITCIQMSHGLCIHSVCTIAT